MNARELKAALEALLFVAGNEGLTINQLVDAMKLDKTTVNELLHELKIEFEQHQRGLQIVEVAGVYQMTTRKEFAPYLRELAVSPNTSTLSQAAIETLAIIAYKQPVTRAEIEDIRGVKCERPIQTLIAKGLIKEAGRAEGVGRPILYRTTPDFLSHFGLNSLKDLPPYNDLTTTEEDEADELFASGQIKEHSNTQSQAEYSTERHGV